MLKLKHLPASHNSPESVNPNTRLIEAINIMSVKNYSQLPVVSGKTIKGVISWKSIARTLFYKNNHEDLRNIEVRHLMEEDPPIIMDEDVFLLKAVDQIGDSEFILVQNKEKDLVGIVTSSDITEAFYSLAEPFIRIGNIELKIRKMIEENFNESEIRNAKDPSDQNREVNDVHDLTFGELIRILEDPSNWSKVEKYKLDKVSFIEGMRKVNEIRNSLFHFKFKNNFIVETKDTRELKEWSEHLKYCIPD